MNYEVKERLLTVSNLSLAYGERQILRDINVAVNNITRPGVEQGQVVALLGPSGCGKTQFFRCLSGMLQPTSGEVLITDKQLRVKGGDVGVVQQAYPLFAHRTIRSNLYLASKKRGKERDAQIDDMLAHFNLRDKLDMYPTQLSGGQRQRVAIIQQLLASSNFLLLDEPFSGLDVMSKERVFSTMRTVSTTHEHNTLIFTTHDLEAAVALADMIWVMGKEGDKPGSTIVKTMDLAAAGLAWHKDIERHPKYWPTVLELKELFRHI